MSNSIVRKLTFGNPTIIEVIDVPHRLMSDLSYVWAKVQTPDGATIDLRGQIVGNQLHLKEDHYPREIKDAEARLRDEEGDPQESLTWVAVMINHVTTSIETIRSDAVALGDVFGASQLGVDERRGSDLIELGHVVQLTLR
ncbi:MAG: hypothetical protein ABWX90_00795 [Candidatus Saccharimonadales bacterium]